MNMGNVGGRIFKIYCHIVFTYPWLIISSTFLVSSLLAFWGIYFHYDAFNLEPSVGFESRNTPLSNDRLSIMKLKQYSADPSDIFFENLKRPKREETTEDKATNLSLSDSLFDLDNSTETFTINYDDYGNDFEAKASDLENVCVQYGALGETLYYEYIDAMAKVVFEVASFDEAFTLPVMRELCRLDSLIERVQKKYSAPETILNPHLIHSFNLPYYSLCLNLKSEKNCEALNEKDILNLKTMILKCESDRSDVLCETKLNDQLFNYILQDTKISKKKYYLGAIMPLNVFSSHKHSTRFFNELLNTLRGEFTGNVKVVGAMFNKKVELFEDLIPSDIKLGVLSAFLVLLCFLFYSRSLLFTICVAAIVGFSLSTAYYIYTTILSLSFFPFVNLLTLVLMISIGADDAFLLLVFYRDLKKNEKQFKVSHAKKNEETEHFSLQIEPNHPDLTSLLKESLSHSLISMFVTSATTAVAFFSNFTSDVIVIRCFGIYAGLTVTVNYLYVLLLLPPVMYITQLKTDDNGFSGMLKRLTTGITTHKDRFIDCLSSFIFNLRYLGVIILILSTMFSLFSVTVYPKIRLPESNPMQYLQKMHPYEWFDDNQHLFNFEVKRTASQVLDMAIGAEPVRDSSDFNPFDSGTFSFTNEFFVDSLKDVNILMDITRAITDSHPKFANRTTWIERFHKFVTSESCVPGCCANKENISNNCLKLYAKRNICPPFPETLRYVPADCPIFGLTGEIKGYFVSVPTIYRMTTVYSETKKTFHLIENLKENISKISTKYDYILISGTEITKLYDLLSRLFSNTQISVAIAVAVSLVVIIFSTQNFLISIAAIIVIGSVILSTLAVVLWMGWTINVVESTIIVLTIGLSFDYTLHYAVAHKHAKEISMQGRIRSTNQSAGIAVLNGAITSILAGFPLTFSATNSFYEIGCFVIIMSILSFIAAVFLFPALLSVAEEWRCLNRRKIKISDSY